MKINKYLDYTNLKAFATKEDIEKLCSIAIQKDFASVCVNPYYVSLANELLSRSDVKVCTVIGFPLGQNTTDVKIYEAKTALEEGADELDMVINIAALKDKYYDYVKNEITAIKEIAQDKIVKVIIETCYLTKDEIIKMTEICNETKVDFIKTSTGFGTEGATIENVKIMNEHKNSNLEIKAAGGIRTLEDALQYIENGATRLGVSNIDNIIKE